MSRENIKKYILKFIYYNYGIQEMEEPCYDIDKMSDYLYRNLLGGLENDKN